MAVKNPTSVFFRNAFAMPTAQQQLTELFSQLIADGSEWGIQLVAYLDGKCVVDLAMGVMDDKTKTPVQKDTLFPVFSVSKGFMATLIHKLVTAGKLSYDMPIADIWPEFAATYKDKAAITLKHVMGHVSGMQHMPMGIGMAEFCNWDAMCDAIAKQKPINAPGQVKEYHAITYGFLLGEVARRVDGRSVSEMLREEIALPLGLGNELFMGIPADVQERVATLKHIFDDGEPVVDDSVPQSIPGWTQPLYRMMNQSPARESCSPGSGGIMSARAIARHYASLLPGGVEGVQLLDNERITIATTQTFTEIEGGRFGLGYQVNEDDVRSTFGHNGHGGAQGYADTTCNLAVGMTHNLFWPSHQGEKITAVLRQSLGLPA